jgi:hypothetical protein
MVVAAYKLKLKLKLQFDQSVPAPITFSSSGFYLSGKIYCGL